MPFSVAGPASPAIPSLEGINRATDRISSGLRTDFKEQAAEAAIAGRLDSQIGESTINIRNAINQSSALQKADQTLGQGKELTQRIQELSVQSTNSVLSETDQLAIQQEVAGLVGDLDSLIEDASFNGEPLFGDNTVDVSAIQDQVNSIDPTNLDQAALQSLQDQFSGLRAEAGAAINGLNRDIAQEFDQQQGLEAQLSQVADTDLATSVAELIKEQLLFEASVKAFNHQKMAEDTIIQLLN